MFRANSASVAEVDAGVFRATVSQSREGLLEGPSQSMRYPLSACSGNRRHAASGASRNDVPDTLQNMRR